MDEVTAAMPCLRENITHQNAGWLRAGLDRSAERESGLGPTSST